jgi:uncharacterized protein YyaL (SSP411 family)
MKKEDLQVLLEELREKMLAIRASRVPPLTDDKILTDWNGYMIFALSMASLYLDEEDLLAKALRSWEGLNTKVIAKDGTIYHRYREGEKAVKGFAHDLIALSLASLGLYESGQNPEHLEQCIAYLTLSEKEFRDPKNGGLFTTSEQLELPLGRQKELMDTAIPSLNSLYGWICYRLFRLTGELKYRERWDETLSLAAVYAEKSPGVAPFLARTHALHEGTELDIVLCGLDEDPVLYQMMEICKSFAFTESAVLLMTPSSEERVKKLSPFTRQMTLDAEAKAYICVQHHCELPINSPEELFQKLNQLFRPSEE